MTIETVIFDLDGTLLDTLGDLADATNAALTRHGYPPRTDGEVRAFVGNGIRRLLQRALPAGADAGEADRLLPDFRAYYEAHMTCRTRPYEGVPALLGALRARGVAVGVLSNKYDPASKALAAHYFPGLIGLTLGERPGVPRKPDPSSAREMLRALHGRPDTALYVGDSDVDMQTAKNAGLFAVGVTWGFRPRETLLAAGADALISRPSALLDIMEGRYGTSKGKGSV